MLTDATREALDDSYHKVYDEPRYITNYPDNTLLVQNQARKHARPAQTTASMYHQTQPEYNRLQQNTVEYGKEVQDELEMCWGQTNSFIEVLEHIGQCAAHCCLHEVLAKVLEYKGVEILKEILTNLFKVVRIPAYLDKLKMMLGMNGEHMVTELVVLFDSLGQRPMDSTTILEAVQPYWQCSKTAEAPIGNPCHTHASSASIQNGLDALISRNDFLPGSTCMEKVVGPLSPAYQPRVTTDTTDVSKDGAKPGLAPNWPPGYCYNIRKPLLTIQCIEAFPYNPTLGYQPKPSFMPKNLPYQCKTETKTVTTPVPAENVPVNIKTGMGLEVVPPTQKRVRFINDEGRISSPEEPYQPQDRRDSLGFPRYKTYLNNILPIKLEHSQDMNAQMQESPWSKVVESPSIIPNPNPGFTAHQQSNKKLPPLSYCLQPTGDRIQDSLGLRFKTQAHKR